MKSQLKNILLHIVCDYKIGGLEYGEILNQFYNYLQNPNEVIFHFTEVPPLDTIAIGFVTAQYAYAYKHGRMVIYGNAAPRRDTEKAKKNNKDNGIFYAKLKNAVEIINVYSEYAFGFVKSDIIEFREVICPDSGSQFRSRDFFPEKIAHIIEQDYAVLGKNIDISSIPDIPNNLVAWIDGFGNIKTTMRKSDLEKMGLKDGDKVIVTLNEISMEGIIATGGFAVDRGQLAINIGSSGFDNPFVELFLRVHSMKEKTAAEVFNYPLGGTPFEIKKI